LPLYNETENFDSEGGRIIKWSHIIAVIMGDINILILIKNSLLILFVATAGIHGSAYKFYLSVTSMKYFDR